MIHLPEFTANASLERSRQTYHGKFQYAGSLSLNAPWRVSIVRPSQSESFSDVNGQIDGDSGAELNDQLGAVDGTGLDVLDDSEGLSSTGDEESSVPGLIETEGTDEEELSEATSSEEG